MVLMLLPLVTNTQPTLDLQELKLQGHENVLAGVLLSLLLLWHIGQV